MNKKGRLIVLEGIDGSGKSTQHKLLVNYLRDHGDKVKTIKFPRHGKLFFGAMVDQYLHDEFGKASKLDPRIASLIFAMDRWEESNKIRNWIRDGYQVIPDRYTTSNMGHQLSKLIHKSDMVKNKFISWNRDMEYKYLRIPKPDLVIYLRVDFQEIKKLLDHRGRGDSHEKDNRYLKNSQLAYDYVCTHSKNWKKINCMKDGHIDSVEKIHHQIVKTIKEHYEK
jgi:dTMP kinase